MKTIPIIAVFLFSNFSICFGQTLSICPHEIGFIVLDDTIYNGTGFLMSKRNLVITCAHVIDTTKRISFDTISMHPLKEVKPVPLKLLKYDRYHDVAILESAKDICAKGPVPHPAHNPEIKINQHIFYAGYDTRESNDQAKTIMVASGIVKATGRMNYLDSTVSFIEFRGIGVPGYSGGPVFNDSGEIIGLMHEAWLKQSIRGGQIDTINRAFLVNPTVLDK